VLPLFSGDVDGIIADGDGCLGHHHYREGIQKDKGGGRPYYRAGTQKYKSGWWRIVKFNRSTKAVLIFQPLLQLGFQVFSTAKNDTPFDPHQSSPRTCLLT
jgi:hypothetical protein